MEENVFVINGEKYSGQYVALKSFSEREVVSAGSEPVAVLKEAKTKGFSDPVIVYLPEKGMVHIY